MANHTRILGTVFMVWGLVSAVVAAVVLGRGLPPGSSPGVFALFALAGTVAFVLVGSRLRAGDERARVPAIVLSALSLLSFPLGTAVGAYGLWTTLANAPRPPRPART